jgi:hypothetical protein
MKPRYAAILAGNVLILAFLIYIVFVSRSQYYLVIAAPEKTIVQLGPFYAAYTCENIRRGMPELIAGERLDEKERGRTLKFMACVPSR